MRYRVADWSELIGRSPTIAAGSPGGFRRHSPFRPDVTHVFGGYWDVYRMAFLSGGASSGIPYPMYPNRSRGWSRGLGPDHGKLLVLQPRESRRAEVAVGRRVAGQGDAGRPIREADRLAASLHDSLESGWARSRRARSSSGRRSVTRASEAQVVSRGTEPRPTGRSAGLFERRPWGRGDLVALLVWTAAIAVFFWDAVSLQRALFYFDITEINYPYRAFFAEELRAGRFSRWCPGLYCGLPLFSESQAGYLHPLKYLLYPWLATWQAFNLDTVLSVWLTGAGDVSAGCGGTSGRRGH